MVNKQHTAVPWLLQPELDGCRPGVPHASLEGLTDYSHCWILYVFHRNTDLHDLWSGDDRGIKAKVHVPKLNGKRTGLFATRSPHRPNPIGEPISYVRMTV